jgi:hypothetical protein
MAKQAEDKSLVKFWMKVSRRRNGCWLWLGAINPNGYGATSHENAHRVAWRLTNGEIPHGMCVLHRCDNKQCVNPAHLFLGTPADNSRDMVAKGRSVKGERQHLSKLTGEDVRNIRRAYGRTDNGNSLARIYGVSRQTISHIVTNQTWKEATTNE